MTIPTQVSGLALSVVTGAIKLGQRIDVIMAEEEALRSNVAIPFPVVTHLPLVAELKKALRDLLAETKDQVPDPIGETDRAKIRALLGQGNVGPKLESFCRKYGITDFRLEAFDPDPAFAQLLLSRRASWDLADDDVRRLTYFVAAGADRRGNSLAFRLGATVLDVFAEFASENVRLLVDHERSRTILQTVLTRFAKPDLAAMSGWGAVLRQAVRATANGLLDVRASLAGDSVWLEHALNALARARDEAPNGDGFVLGLFRGEGFDRLIREVLVEGGTILSAEDTGVFENVLGGVLLEAAQRVDGSADFREFFRDEWHHLVSAGLGSLQRHGPVLLEGEDPILEATLSAFVGSLAESFGAGPPTGDTLVTAIEASIGVVADHPEFLENGVAQLWMRDLIGSLADVVRDVGLRKAFTGPTLERYGRETLATLSRHPHVLGADSDLAEKIVSGVLGDLAQSEALDIESLADAALTGALGAIAENPDLIDSGYADAIGNLAGRLANRVAARSITGLQCEDLLDAVIEVVATNDQLFLKARDGLAGATLDALLGAADDDPKRILAGSLLVSTGRRVLLVLAARGGRLPKNETLEALEARAEEVLATALQIASTQLGKRIAQDGLPDALGRVIEDWATNSLPGDPGSAEFATYFGEVMDAVTAAAA